MNLTLRELEIQILNLSSHKLTDTNVERVEQTAQGVKVHVDQTELLEQLADAQLELAEFRSDLARVLAEHKDDLAALRAAITELVEE